MLKSMNQTGYSDTPLPKKLGIKSGFRVAIQNAPDHFEQTLGLLPEKVEIVEGLEPALDVIVFFVHDRAEYQQQFDRLNLP